MRNRRKLTIQKDEHGLFIKTNGRKYRPDYDFRRDTASNSRARETVKNLGLSNDKVFGFDAKVKNPQYGVGDKVFCEDDDRAIFGEHLVVENQFFSKELAIENGYPPDQLFSTYYIWSDENLEFAEEG